MPRLIKWTLACVSVVAAVIAITTGVSGQIYLGAAASPRFLRTRGPAVHKGRRVATLQRRHQGHSVSPLDRIDTTNFGKLELAWRFKTDNLGSRPEFKLEGTPIMVKGVLYIHGRCAAGGRRARRQTGRGPGPTVFARGQTRRDVSAPALRPGRCSDLERRPRR